MTLGNRPKEYKDIKVGKRYWRLAVGRDAIPARYFSDGWRAFEFVLFKPYEVLEPGSAHPYSMRIAFVFWLPFALA